MDVLLAEDNLALSREQKGAIEVQLQQAKRYFEAGVGTITDINEAQARYDTTVAQELAAENNLELKVRSLEQLVGDVKGPFQRFPSDLTLDLPEPAQIDAWVNFSIDNNPSIKAREAGLEVAQKEVSKNIAAHLPTVDLVASRSRSENPGYTTLNTLNWNNTIGVQVAIPLFSGGSTQGRVDQAAALREKAMHELEATKRSVIQSTRQEYLNVMNGVAQIKALRQAVKSNELALYSARKGLEAGLRTSFDVLNAQQLLFSAKRDLALEGYRYVLARLKLRAAAGMLDSADVARVQAWLVNDRM
jgi:outer membrane protein